jgi:creatinine amidohydrolase
VPFGILEKHGNHLPWALDALKAHGVCCRCARVHGGLVLPPSYLAGVHEPWVPDRDEETRLQAGVGDFYLRPETYRLWLEDVFRGLANIGFRCIVAYSGHYPVLQIDILTRVADEFNRTESGACVIPFVEPMACNGEGDHAGRYETSLMLALDPGLTRLSAIRPEQRGRTGFWSGTDPSQTASAEFGETVIQAVSDYLGTRVKAALATTGPDCARHPARRSPA